jgi:hypothetical protein
MSTKAGVGYSEKTNSREAGAEAVQAALRQAGTSDCDVVMLFATSKHDPVLLREGVRAVAGNRPRLFGGSAIGVITNERMGYEGSQVGAAVISSDTIRLDMLMEKGLPDNEYAVGRALGAKIRANTNGHQGNMILLYDIVKNSTATEGLSMNMATPLLQGLDEEFGAWPVTAGGGMAGDMQFKPTYQMFEDRIEQQSAMALMFGGDAKLDTITMHGCKPSSSYYTVTKADKNNVQELDGRPTTEVIASLLGPDSDKSWSDYPLFITLGVNNGDQFGDYNEDDYAVRLCMDVDRKGGGLMMFGDDLTAGKQVQLMRRSIDLDYIRQRAERLLAQLAGRKPVIAFYIDCGGRAAAFCGMDREEAEEVQKVFGSRVPLLGWYVGCEIAKAGPVMQSHNWTGVLCVLSE